MPSHSLRLCWCNSDRGHKSSARPRVQLRPKAAAAKPENGADFSEHLADFSRKRGGFLGGKLPKHGQKITIAGRILPVRLAEILRRNFLMMEVNEFLTVFGTSNYDEWADNISFSSNENDILKIAVVHDDFGGAYVRASAVEEMLEHLAKILNNKYYVEYDAEKVKFCVGSYYSNT